MGHDWIGIASGCLVWLAMVVPVWFDRRMPVGDRPRWALAVALLPIPLFPVFLFVAGRRSNPGTASAVAADSIHSQG